MELVCSCTATTLNGGFFFFFLTGLNRGCWIREEKVLTSKNTVALNLFYLTYSILSAGFQEFQFNDSFYKRQSKGITYHHYKVAEPIKIMVFLNLHLFIISYTKNKKVGHVKLQPMRTPLPGKPMPKFRNAKPRSLDGLYKAMN